MTLGQAQCYITLEDLALLQASNAVYSAQEIH
jgi:hypothetical protein